ncbi:hypothetical protein LOC67_16020 [Stieleria sp. JC731]|uniref:DUF6980 family protein n=1 Tax=Pirellulaceae TaxID=2691357 RepID=UPI001E3DCF8F|nr:hypothetical protein [Stieleria sp. JC731]MCC9602070.1 hypothetical protein [Stieleria sp. JC731]
MNCEKFRALSERIDAKDISEEISEWVSHQNSCTECGDWALAKKIRQRGFDPDDFSCVHLANYATMTCEQHPQPLECPDILVAYIATFDEYVLPVRDGGPSYIAIKHCPWCGVRVPESKRSRWFDELRELGIKYPIGADLPEAYTSDAWWKSNPSND